MKINKVIISNNNFTTNNIYTLTDRQSQFLNLWNDGYSPAEIADEMKVGATRVTHLRDRLAAYGHIKL
jgi:DNA-binding CsgD family transcriptional regulator